MSFEDRYALLVPLGETARGCVWSAKDGATDKSVAVAILDEDADEVSRKRFQAIHLGVRVSHHPTMVRVLETGETSDGSLYASYELIEGDQLRGRLSDGPPIPLDRAVKAMADVLDALGNLHDQGLAHGDVSPGNILVRDKGERLSARVIGLGLGRARIRAGEAPLDEPMQLIELAYMSPAQARGEVVYDAKSDVYSAAAVLYSVLTGNPPHYGETAASLRDHVIDEPVPPVREARGAIPEALASVVDRALDEGFEDAPTLAKALRDALAAHPELADMESPIGRLSLEPSNEAAPEPEPEPEVEAQSRSAEDLARLSDPFGEVSTEKMDPLEVEAEVAAAEDAPGARAARAPEARAEDEDEAAKPEDAKPEDAKPEDAKPEDAKPEDAKPEAAKPEAAKPEAAKPRPKPFPAPKAPFSKKPLVSLPRRRPLPPIGGKRPLGPLPKPRTPLGAKGGAAPSATRKPPFPRPGALPPPGGPKPKVPRPAPTPPPEAPPPDSDVTALTSSELDLQEVAASEVEAVERREADDTKAEHTPHDTSAEERGEDTQVDDGGGHEPPPDAGDEVEADEDGDGDSDAKPAVRPPSLPPGAFESPEDKQPKFPSKREVDDSDFPPAVPDLGEPSAAEDEPAAAALPSASIPPYVYAVAALVGLGLLVGIAALALGGDDEPEEPVPSVADDPAPAPTDTIVELPDAGPEPEIADAGAPEPEEPTTFTISLSGVPEGAQVLVNGEAIEGTDVVLDAPPRGAEIEVRREGSQTWTHTVGLEPPESLEVTLEPVPPPPPATTSTTGGRRGGRSSTRRSGRSSARRGTRRGRSNPGIVTDPGF